MLSVAIAVFVAVLGVTLWQANSDRADRAKAQEPRPAVSGNVEFRVRQVDAQYADDVWTTIFVFAETPSPSPPPGLAAFPAPGEVWVSPAVEKVQAERGSAANRIPGPITGVIGRAGLQSPDQLFVYVGSKEPGPSWWRAEGWGAKVEATARPTVPQWPLLVLVLVLVGLPVTALVRGTAQLAVETRGRELAGLHLLGVPRGKLSIAAATDAAWCGASGGVGGAIIAAVATSATHQGQMLGFSWFQPSWSHRVLVAVVVVLAASWLVWTDVRRRSERALRDPWGARAGTPRTWHWWRLVPFVLGLSLLVAVVVPYLVFGTRYGSVLTTGYFFVGTLLGLLGAVAALAPLMGWWARRAGNSARSAAVFLGTRRLQWDRERIATGCAGLVLTCVSGAVGAGALADLAALSPERAGGDRYAVGVGGLDTGEAAAAIAVTAPLRYLQVSDVSGTSNIADCGTLTRVLGLDDRTASADFAAQCRQGTEQRVVVGQATQPSDIVLRSGDPSGLVDTTVISVPVEDYRGSLRRADLLVYPGRGDQPVTDYLDRLLTAAPHAQVTNTQADSYKPMVAPTRRLLIVCSLLGLMVGATLLAVVALGSMHRTRVQAARLAVMGGTRAVAARAHTVAFAHGALVAVVVGLTLGGLAGTAYTIAGGITTGPGSLGMVVLTMAIAITGFALLVTWATARFANLGTLSELIQRE